jgi:hypothetical protein
MSRCHKFEAFAPGDEFYMKTIPRRFIESSDLSKIQKISLKLQYRYTGPHTVQRVINPVVYECIVNGNIRNVHANKMKRATKDDRHIDRTLREHPAEHPNGILDQVR